MSQRKKLSTTPPSRSSQSKVPQRSGQRNVEENDDDDGGDDDFTQPSTSQAQMGLETFSRTQIDEKVGEIVRFFLMKDQKKFPIRRADVIKHMLKVHRSAAAEIMKRVASTLEEVFGLKLVEIDQKNHLYMLINKLDTVDGLPDSLTPSNPKTGLLFVILGAIFMKGGTLKESILLRHLMKMHVDPGKKHEVFGDVKKLISEEFVRQRYLEYKRLPHADPVDYEVRWGQRAVVEVSKVKLIEMMGEVLNRDPKSWSQQYKEATNTIS